MVSHNLQKNLSEYLKEGALIVDVRSLKEYIPGHIEGSINVPLRELENKIHILDKSKMILLCCASGSRSGMAETL